MVHCVCVYTAVVHNTVQNSSDNLPCYHAAVVVIAQLLSIGREGEIWLIIALSNFLPLIQLMITTHTRITQKVSLLVL